jgi:arsenite methyltransferase
MNESPETIRDSIKERYSRLARSPGVEEGFPVGPKSAKLLGYSAKEIDELPDSATESFAGVGNPFSLGEIGLGQTVLDLGCGAGMDSILAARKVGPSGKVIGVDATEEMIVKARRNAEELNLTKVEFHHGDVESLPVANDTVDTVISNGVFNLCLDKPRVLREVFRVLRAGGRFFMADMILEDHVTPEKVQLMGSWSG